MEESVGGWTNKQAYRRMNGWMSGPRLNILARAWQDLSKILARSWQDPEKILTRSWQDLAKISHDLAGFNQDLANILPRFVGNKILARSYKIRQDLAKMFNLGMDGWRDG